jgi:hypothetical protein
MFVSVHFVGFRGDEYSRAVKVWGKPTFVHRIWDVRAAAEVSEGDLVVFARAKDWANLDSPNTLCFDDSAVF